MSLPSCPVLGSVRLNLRLRQCPRRVVHPDEEHLIVLAGLGPDGGRGGGDVDAADLVAGVDGDTGPGSLAVADVVEELLDLLLAPSVPALVRRTKKSPLMSPTARVLSWPTSSGTAIV